MRSKSHEKRRSAKVAKKAGPQTGSTKGGGGKWSACGVTVNQFNTQLGSSYKSKLEDPKLLKN